jgi:hypothetical protein
MNNNKQNKKVFVVSKSGHDFSDARRYGELVTISEGIVDKWEINHMHRIASEAMKGSSSEDYILLSGLPSLQVMCCSFFAAAHQRLNLLIFKDGKYLERTIVFNQDQKEEQE